MSAELKRPRWRFRRNCKPTGAANTSRRRSAPGAGRTKRGSLAGPTWGQPFQPSRSAPCPRLPAPNRQRTRCGHALPADLGGTGGPERMASRPPLPAAGSSPARSTSGLPPAAPRTPRWPTAARAAAPQHRAPAAEAGIAGLSRIRIKPQTCRRASLQKQTARTTRDWAFHWCRLSDSN